MQRIHRFFGNVGPAGLIQSGVLIFIVGVALTYEFRTGTWIYSVPVLLAVFCAGYLIRDLLVDNLGIVARLMNMLAIAGIVLALLMPRMAGANPLPMRLAILGFIGAYLGCYFWMLSDARVTLLRLLNEEND